MFPDNSNERAANDIERFGNSYKSLITKVKAFFDWYKSTSDGQRHIYRLYTRSDKQSGAELKETWKVASKMRSNNYASATDVYDIVGLTVVCPFETDVSSVVKMINSRIFKKDFELVNQITHNGMYKAYHVIASTKSEPQFKCEIQIKTMFHDAWTTKSHDMTYKPKGIISKKYESQMGTLSQILSALEMQSENIRDMIDEIVEIDKRKRADARRRVVEGLSQSLENCENPQEKIALQTFTEFYNKNKTKIASSSLDSNVIESFRSRSSEIGDKFGYGRYLCRIIAAAVVSRTNPDLLVTIDYAISRWKQRVETITPYPVLSPYHFYSLVLYALGHLEYAAKEAEAGIKFRERCPDEAKYNEALAASYGAVAHFYGELCWSYVPDSVQAEHYKNKAEGYIAKAANLQPDDAGILDTSGFIRIIFSIDEQSAEEGLALCAESRRKARGTPDEQVSDLFYNIHKRIAYRKILSFDVTDSTFGK